MSFWSIPVSYTHLDEDLIEAMRELMQYADVVTPNLTEACALTDTLYQENGWSKRKLSDLTWKPVSYTHLTSSSIRAFIRVMDFSSL